MTGYTGNTITVPANFNNCTRKVSLLQLEEYKKVFQSFWVRMIEQFVPATTIFVSGEKWCNNDDLICTEIEECDFDFEYVDSEITVIEYGTDFEPSTGSTVNRSGGDVGEENDGGINTEITPTGRPNNSNDGPINDNGIVIEPIPNDPGDTYTERVIPMDNPILIRERAFYDTTLIIGKQKIVFE